MEFDIHHVENSDLRWERGWFSRFAFHLFDIIRENYRLGLKNNLLYKVIRRKTCVDHSILKDWNSLRGQSDRVGLSVSFYLLAVGVVEEDAFERLSEFFLKILFSDLGVFEVFGERKKGGWNLDLILGLGVNENNQKNSVNNS